MARAEDLGGRLRALREAAEGARGRVDDAVVERAETVVNRAGRRLELAGDSTVIALGGATGSGKSSTFNALSGTELAVAGVRRPTTSKAMAATFGDTAAEDLLDWLDIRTRHHVPNPTAAAADIEAAGAAQLEPDRSRTRMPSVTQHLPKLPTLRRREAGPANFDGLVLIDLPDHDSTEVAHRQEVDRLVELVDMLIWVVDPQKYADAALHDGYLKPLARYAPVMLVVLNQIDRLDEAERKRCVSDLRRLLDSEGLQQTQIAAISASTGEGVAELQQLIRSRVADKQASTGRISADVDGAAEALAAESGTAPVGHVTKGAARRLDQAMAAAAGVEVVAEAVGGAWRHRGGLATGWPVLAWLARFRPDPLRRLHLDRWGAGKRGEEIDPARVSRTSLPATTSVQQARVDSAVRDLADAAADGLSRGWVAAVRAAARGQQERVSDQLDRAVATTDLELDRNRGWWKVVTVLQWILVAAVVAGLAWLGVAFLMLYLQLPPLPEVRWWGIPAPTVLLVGGVGLGLLVAALARIGVEVGARRKQRRARAALLASISGVTRRLVIDPVNEELDRYEGVRSGLERARR
ncbi:ABC transporter [Enemella dayhoffiae]|uniref:ABC transporter n=1 Tax=Enemella dayhoffiae TaxID=2016507 RepID=A0A255H0Z5_9ACTN|nr:dynamin family protein [Enemella dayhoffiae]OYO20923.1 ABC transporter [Enemella dayhoffiae]